MSATDKSGAAAGKVVTAAPQRSPKFCNLFDLRDGFTAV